MGRTLPSASQVFLQEEQSFANFRGALSKSDQVALGDLFALARRHVAEVAFAAHLMPFETILLAMLLEEHKEVMRLRERMAGLKERAPRAQPRFEIPAATAVVAEQACSAIHIAEPADGGVAPARHVAVDEDDLDDIDFRGSSSAPHGAETVDGGLKPPRLVQYVPVEEYC